MKKLALILAVLLLICCLSFVLVACGENGKDGQLLYDNFSNKQGEIKYEVQYGVNANTISKNDRQFYTTYINDYTTFCKSAYKESLLRVYKNLSVEEFGRDPYLFIDNIFIYDYRDVDFTKFNQSELAAYNGLTENMLCGKKPKFFIFCNGVCNYYGNNYFTTLIEASAIVFSIFVAEDNSFVARRYSNLSNYYYTFSVPQSVKIINFGDEFSMTYKPTVDQLKNFSPKYLVLKEKMNG